MVLSVDITKNCKLIYKKELKQREYLYNEVVPTAWLPDSIPQVILPCANLTLFTQQEKKAHQIHPDWKYKDGIYSNVRN